MRLKLWGSGAYNKQCGPKRKWGKSADKREIGGSSLVVNYGMNILSLDHNWYDISKPI